MIRIRKRYGNSARYFPGEAGGFGGENSEGSRGKAGSGSSCDQRTLCAGASGHGGGEGLLYG